MTKMLRKIIAIVLVSFFIMTGLSVLNQGNQNYNIFENSNQIKTDTISSNNIIIKNPNKIYHIQYMPKRVINGTYTHALFSQLFISYNGNIYYANGSNIVNQYNKTLLTFPSSYVFTVLSIYKTNLYIAFTNGNIYVYNFSQDKNYFVDTISSNSVYFGNNSLFVFLNGIIYYYTLFYSSVDNKYILSKSSSIVLFTNSPEYNWDSSSNGNYINMLIEGNSGDDQTYFYMIQKNPFELYYSDTYGYAIQAENNSYSANNFTFFDRSSYGFFNNNLFSTINYDNQYSSMSTAMENSNNYLIPFTINQSSLGANTSYFFPNALVGYTYNTFFENIGNMVNPTLFEYNISENINSGSRLDIIFGINNTYFISYSQKEIFVFNNNIYNLNVKSFNLNDFQINNYFLFKGNIYSGSSINFIINSFPAIITPLNTTQYFYNGSAITITQSDFTGSGSNLYYNLTIYYGFGNVQSTITSNSLYLIILYVVIGLGLAIFVIASVRYRI